MMKFLQEFFKDYHAAQQELQTAGIINIITMNGMFTYIDPYSVNQVNIIDDKSRPVSEKDQ
jgi:hypothetical protein